MNVLDQNRVSFHFFMILLQVLFLQVVKQSAHNGFFLNLFSWPSFVRGNILGFHNIYNRYHKPATRQGPVTGTVVLR